MRSTSSRTPSSQGLEKSELNAGEQPSRPVEEGNAKLEEPTSDTRSHGSASSPVKPRFGNSAKGAAAERRNGDDPAEPQKTPAVLENQMKFRPEHVNEDCAEPEAGRGAAEEEGTSSAPPNGVTASSSSRPKAGKTSTQPHMPKIQQARGREAAPQLYRKKVVREELSPIGVGSQKRCAPAPGGSRLATRTVAAGRPTTTSGSSAVGVRGSGTMNPVARPQTAPRGRLLSSCPLNEVDKHGGKNPFGLDLRGMFQRINFSQVYRELHRSSDETLLVQECQHLFRVISKDKGFLDAADVEEMLIIFTPCGVLLREAADFLKEECEGKTSLNFPDFLRYGPALRARLRAYEVFERLTDRQKLISIHARVLRNGPPLGVHTARLHLVRITDQQVKGKLPRHVRPLRLYEANFIVDYQESLRESAVIPESEELPQGLQGDYEEELGRAYPVRHIPRLPQLAVPVLSKEDVAWREENVVDYTDSNESSVTAKRADAERPAAAAHESNGYPRLSQRNRTATAAKGSGTGYQRKGYAAKRVPYGRGGQTSSLHGAVEVYGARGGRMTSGPERHPGIEEHRHMGRFVADDYRDRRTMDDHLITQLEFMYTMP